MCKLWVIKKQFFNNFYSTKIWQNQKIEYNEKKNLFILPHITVKKTVKLGETTRICAQQPDKKTIDQLNTTYNLHEMVVEDILNVNAQSKINTSGEHLFLALTFTKYLPEESKYIFNEMDAIIGKDFIITTTAVESDKLNTVFETINAEAKQTHTHSYKTSPYYILYRIIDAFYDKTLKSLTLSSQKLLDIQAQMTKNNENVIDELTNEDLNKIFVKHNFLSQEEIIDELIHHVQELHDKHLTTYFNDLKPKLAKIIRTINVLTEKNDALLGAYNTFLSIRNNKSVTRLTFINSIFLPLTLLASIGGMSERSMITGPENWKITYPLFLLLCVAIAYITFLVLRKFFLKK